MRGDGRGESEEGSNGMQRFWKDKLIETRFEE